MTQRHKQYLTLGDFYILAYFFDFSTHNPQKSPSGQFRTPTYGKRLSRCRLSLSYGFKKN
jgi:hypothetical protein